MAQLASVAYADMSHQDVYSLTEGNLLQMIRVMQLMLQHVAYERDLKHHRMQALKEKELLVERFIRGMAALSLNPLPAALAAVRRDFQSLEGHDLDAMLAKVRAEAKFDNGAEGPVMPEQQQEDLTPPT